MAYQVYDYTFILRKNLLSPPSKKLLDQLRDQVSLKHYSTRTADSYVYWARQFILFHNLRHPKEMGMPEINQFLTHLAVEKKVAASTRTRP